MELILHFGMHKTGSSSLQDTLYSLELPDVTFINFGRPNPSFQITQGFSKNFHKRPIFAREQLTAKDIEDRTSKSRDQLTKALRSVKTKRAILSAEAIANLDPTEIADFIMFVRPFTAKIRALGYVREAKSYAESVFQERIKHCALELNKFLVKIKYRQLIEGLDAVLGKDNVEVYKFDRRTLQRGCVVKDFCYRCDIDLQDDQIILSNESLSRSSVQLLYILWKYYPEFYRTQYTVVQKLSAKSTRRSLDSKINQSIIRNAVEKVSQFPGMKMKLHSDLYRKIVNIDEKELEWLEKRTGITFDEDIYAHDNIGIKDEKDMMRFEPDTVRLLLENLELKPNNACRLINNHKLLAKHILMLVS